MAKPRIYLETSVISYLAAKPSTDAIKITRQYFSTLLWDKRADYDLLISQFVLDEVALGDETAAARRAQYCELLPKITVNPETLQVAQTLIQRKAVPQKAYTDALHLAAAALADVQFIVSWNFRHIVGALARQKIEHELTSLVGQAPIIATPEEIVESLK